MTSKRILLVLVLIVLGAMTYGGFYVLRHGFSAREKPSQIEAFLARHARRIATPAEAKSLRNPYPITPERLGEAREHWVAHCSSCHGVDGRGNTTIGRNLYPKAPDMTDSETQGLTDGELFYIISNGVRFTGMPAWGGEDSSQSIWDLVSFIRKLPALSPDELKFMEGMTDATEHTHTADEALKQHVHAPGSHRHKQ